jgi:phosphoribosylglycinamide formyltransferase 2
MKILLLGSGELGKEFTIAAQRIGQTIIAVDSYENAPAMQVAHGFEVINMLDGEALDRIVAKHKPDFIVPEIEAIRTERFTITKTRYYCSSFCESGKFHNEPKSHP